MKKLLFPIIALLLALPLAQAQENVLNLFTWAEYIDPEIVRDFEEEFNARVVIDLFESNEDAIGKLQAGSLGLYDVVIPSNYAIPVFIELGFLQPLDHDIVTNLDNLSPTFRDPPYDPGNVFTAAYQWGTTGIAYRNDLVDTPTSWAVLFDPEGTDQTFTLIDDSRPMIGAALLYLGFDYNSEVPGELEAARDLLIEVKNRSLGFFTSVTARNMLLTGDTVYAVIYSGDAIVASFDDERISYTVPSEGSEIWVDSMAVLAQAPNPELANEFINFILRPDIGARLTNYVAYASPNAAALPFIDEDIRDNPLIFVSDEIMDKLVFTEDIERIDLYDLIWTQIKSR